VPFLGILVGKIWRCFFAGFVLGITQEVGVPLFLVILPSNLIGRPSILVVFEFFVFLR
jgi:hypothetical protein